MRLFFLRFLKKGVSTLHNKRFRTLEDDVDQDRNYSKFRRIVKIVRRTSVAVSFNNQTTKEYPLVPETLFL